MKVDLNTRQNCVLSELKRRGSIPDKKLDKYFTFYEIGEELANLAKKGYIEAYYNDDHKYWRAV